MLSGSALYSCLPSEYLKQFILQHFSIHLKNCRNYTEMHNPNMLFGLYTKKELQLCLFELLFFPFPCLVCVFILERSIVLKLFFRKELKRCISASLARYVYPSLLFVLGRRRIVLKKPEIDD